MRKRVAIVTRKVRCYTFVSACLNAHKIPGTVIWGVSIPSELLNPGGIDLSLSRMAGFFLKQIVPPARFNTIGVRYRLGKT
jgi:hypothetical protein